MGHRILIGSCGGLTGSYLARQFRAKGCFVCGADSNEHNATRPFLDAFFALPSTKALDFMDKLVQLLLAQKIDFYFPTHSQEIKIISQNEALLHERWGTGFIVSPFETYQMLDSKKDANRNLQAAGLPVPRLYEEITQGIAYPIFMKPNIGSGSRKAQSIETVVLHREYARLDSDCCFFEQISGTEYTVDCLFNQTGQLIGYNSRIRVKSMGGAAIVSQNDSSFDILPYLRKLEQAFVFKGCVNFQYILADGTPYFIDANLRYASGGLPLTVASGIDVPQLLLDLLEGKPISHLKSCGANRLTMYRYFNELFEDEST